jgi:hypothetical protein
MAAGKALGKTGTEDIGKAAEALESLFQKK